MIEESEEYRIFSLHLNGKCASFKSEESYYKFMQNVNGDPITKIIYHSENGGKPLYVTRDKFEKWGRPSRLRRKVLIELLGNENKVSKKPQ